MPATNKVPSANWREMIKHLDNGMLNSMPIYMHFTNIEGIDAIIRSKKITGSRANQYRAGANAEVYLNPASQWFSPTQVWENLLLARPEYKNRGEYVAVFALKTDFDLTPKKVSSYSDYLEIGFDGQITFTKSGTDDWPVKHGQAKLLYIGPNMFDGKM